jgi:uncharacterized protein (DUF1501 family)
VFAPLFDARSVDMQRGTTEESAGDLRWVAHPSRPEVTTFFAEHAARSAIVNGLSVPSVSHDICALLALTGDGGGAKPDWPTLLASLDEVDRLLPSLVLAGPSFTGDLGALVSRVGESGQLQRLLDGSATTQGDGLPAVASARTRGLIDAFVADAATARASGASTVARDFADSARRARSLQELGSTLNLGGYSDFSGQVDAALEVLALGLSRCVTLSSGTYSLYWDSHAGNDDVQTYNFELLFSGLRKLLDGLAATPSPDGGVLLDDTLVVVLSEMGRTPQYNSGAGRDHWPFTSAMLVGQGIVGGQVISGYDDGFNGKGYNAATGSMGDSFEALTPEALGATLLTLVGADVDAVLPGVVPIAALL